MRFHLDKIDNPIANSTRNNIYVDNIQNAFHDEDSMEQFYINAKHVMSEAGFPLREWNSNSESLNSVMEADGDYSRDGSATSVLGYDWNTITDYMSVKAFGTRTLAKFTKRSIVSELSKLYDPIGITLPVSIRSRILIQKLWKSEGSWDEEVPHVMVKEFLDIQQDFVNVHRISIPRCAYDNVPVTLHIFCDASTVVFGAVAYFSCVNKSSFVMAKARVAPIKQITLPQLELMAMTLASRISSFIVSELTNVEIISVNIYSDSLVALCWLRSNGKLKQFVKSRVNEIKVKAPNANFFHIEGNRNLADLVTRGIKLDELKDSNWIGLFWILTC